VNSYFVVERQKEKIWTQIGQVQAASTNADYYFRDLIAAPGIYQYRLKYITGQKASYSAIRQVIVTAATNRSISYNSFTKQLFFRGFTDKNDLLRIFNAEGLCIYQTKITSPASEWQLNTSFLNSGLYIVTNANVVTKFIVTFR